MLIWPRISYCFFCLVIVASVTVPLAVGIHLHQWTATGAYALAWLGLLFAALISGPVRVAVSCRRNGDKLEFVFPFGFKQIPIEQVEHYCLLPPGIGCWYRGGLFFRKGRLILRIRGEKRLIQLPSDDVHNSALRLLKEHATVEVSYEAILYQSTWKKLIINLLFAVFIIGMVYFIFTTVPPPSHNRY